MGRIRELLFASSAHSVAGLGSTAYAMRLSEKGEAVKETAPSMRRKKKGKAGKASAAAAKASV